MPWNDETNYKKLTRQIEDLGDPEAAEGARDAILDIVDQLPEADVDIFQPWLGPLANLGLRPNTITSRRYTLLETYPSGTHGRGREDRIYIELGHNDEGYWFRMTAGISRH